MALSKFEQDSINYGKSLSPSTYKAMQIIGLNEQEFWGEAKVFIEKSASEIEIGYIYFEQDQKTEEFSKQTITNWKDVYGIDAQEGEIKIP